MGEPVACWWAEPTGEAVLSLRRYAGDRQCAESPWGYCNAHADLGATVPVVRDEEGVRQHHGVDVPRSDPAWPRECPWCGRPFADDDVWQVNDEPLYRRGRDGDLVTLTGPNGESGKGPPGMLLHLPWHPHGPWRDRYGDGINLYAVCPNGLLWHVDGAARSGGEVTAAEAWTRTGDPRQPATLSVKPSIVAGDYHGFLTAGVFSVHLG